MADEEVEELPEVEIEVVADDAAAVPPVITADDGVEVLRAQLETEATRRREAEARARKAEEEAFAARTDQHETNLQLVESAIAEMERNREIIKAGIEQAKAAGDIKAELELEEELADTRDKLSQLKAGQQQLSTKTIEKPAPVVETDPLEKLTSVLTPKSADWVRRHPETATDKKAYNRMIAAHHSALADDLVPDTPEYFAHLDRVYAPPAPVKEEPVEVMSSASKVVEAPVVAPVDRGGSSKTQVRLTAAEREAAELSGLTELEYAKQKMRIQATRH